MNNNDNIARKLLLLLSSDNTLTQLSSLSYRLCRWLVLPKRKLLQVLWKDCPTRFSSFCWDEGGKAHRSYWCCAQWWGGNSYRIKRQTGHIVGGRNGEQVPSELFYCFTLTIQAGGFTFLTEKQEIDLRIVWISTFTLSKVQTQSHQLPINLKIKFQVSFMCWGMMSNDIRLIFGSKNVLKKKKWGK